MSADTCASCRYYVMVESKRGTKEELGECYLNPPTVCGESEDEGQFQARPYVWESDFCGRWVVRLTS